MSKTRAAKLQEIIGLCMKVNEETKYCVFADFSGHVHWLDIRIASSKKDYHNHVLTSQLTYKNSSDDYFNRRYDEIKSVLVSILKTGKADYNHENVWKEERIEYDYKF